ncbi:TPA: hypothetical protein ACHTCR_000663 [Pseudomonas putida]|jgi:hypothetical protein|uniref:Uncharacterized protein n=4 Tax=Pseudomonas TaxID=286 RepID=A0A7W2KE25_9PSED|nr:MULTISPECIES: hypothetical protein [Pseudomonas]EKJ7936198.1 hypothetical protein [Pseudomonas aeruginosa]AGN83065.1 hypothetical protein L483_22120 [Pseudomonas putida H8234]EKT4502447.1 hypothetical protein [Pseudomonas putida]EKU2260416.1 hypothetical protein [Pseudomonas aeruginosa]EKU7816159.1 hypothetical protein [Pseudomonas aeruginosa]
MESFWLCEDCLQAVAYDDFSTLSLYYSEAEVDERIAQIREAVQALLPFSADFDPDTGIGIDSFSTRPCESCHSPLHGTRHRFTRL